MIVIKDVKKRFGETVALAGIDLHVERGEIFSLLGPNGAGKTTLLRILTTLLRPDQGEARVAGFSVITEPDEVRRRIGVTFQEHALDPNLTGREVLLDSGALHGLSRARVLQRMDDLAAIINMDEALDRRVKTYSGGMKRRLELARALLPEPEILFLDEPTQGLDPQNRRALWDHLEGLSRDVGITIFLTTHYMEEAEHLSHRVAIMDHGRILALGQPKELAAGIGDVIYLRGEGEGNAAAQALSGASFVRWVEQGDDGLLRVAVTDGGRDLVDTITTVAGTGYEIRDVEIRRPSLDEVFLRLTGRGLRD
ncbi:MAG TPA: ATP-binding cassette domain-containing protein [Sphingobacteriaceae bacterium]|nr:ATP-binding cassette domain-containing protein [Sphingobacteriaceae bacterium]